MGGTITITPSTTAWTNQNVTVTITYPTIGGTTKQYSTNGVTWNNYTGPLTITDNCTVYASLLSGTTRGSTATLSITKIDKLTPYTFTLAYDVTKTSITVSGSTLDQPSSGTGGTTTGIQKYQYKLDSRIMARQQHICRLNKWN